MLVTRQPADPTPAAARPLSQASAVRVLVSGGYLGNSPEDEFADRFPVRWTEPAKSGKWAGDRVGLRSERSEELNARIEIYVPGSVSGDPAKSSARTADSTRAVTAHSRCSWGLLATR